MGNSQSKLKRTSNKLKVVKRTIKYISVALDLAVVREVIKKAPNTVIGAISNGALNCRQGAVRIPSQLLPLSMHHNHHFDYLVDRRKSIPSKRHLILQKGGALPIIAPLLATVLSSIGGDIISRLCVKMTSSFSKKVLIEQAELDSLQQRQLREHSPELQAMVRLLNNMKDITAKTKLTAAEQLNSISGLQIQFDKLKKKTGLLSGTMPSQVAFEAPLAALPVQPKVLADKGIGLEIEPEDKEQEEQYEDVLEENYMPAQASTLSPQIARVIR